MIDGGILNFVALWFKNASMGWSSVIAVIMQPLLIELAGIAWFLALITEVFVPGWNLLPTILMFFMGLGFCLAMLDFGPLWIQNVFEGVATIAYMLGVPPLNPSAVASYGIVIADPIMKTIADQGLLSYLTNPLTWSLTFTSLAIILAFFILAFILLGNLVISYLLTAATPFFMCFFILSYTRGLAMMWIRLVFGTMASLFMTALLTAIVSELGANMEQWIRTTVLAPGHALTWADLIGPMAIGVALMGFFAWLPLHIGRAAYGIIPSLSGGRSVVNVGGTVVNSTMPSGGSSGGGGGGGGGQPQVVQQNSGGGSGWSGGGFNGSQTSTQRQPSAWGK